MIKDLIFIAKYLRIRRPGVRIPSGVPLSRPCNSKGCRVFYVRPPPWTNLGKCGRMEVFAWFAGGIAVARWGGEHRPPVEARPDGVKAGADAHRPRRKPRRMQSMHQSGVPRSILPEFTGADPHGCHLSRSGVGNNKRRSARQDGFSDSS